MPILSVSIAVIILLVVGIAIAFRTVVDTNKVHIVQSRKKTISYGTGQSAGNVYYSWPSWIPIIGLSYIELPVSNFNLSLNGYHAYDKERVPFEIDVTAFFRIKDTTLAAQRVSSFDDLGKQLMLITQGAVRKVLASNDINEIMIDRSTFGKQFTEEVTEQLGFWGVEPVKNMELMDIRDTDTSQVIHNIMAKKSSHIAMESRVEVANNMQAAETAEVAARRAVDISVQEAAQAVGEKTAEKDKVVGVANQQARQEIATAEAVTKDKEMDVIKVGQVRQAEIAKEAALVLADQDKQVVILKAEGQLQSTTLHAQGVQIEGSAKAAAEKAMLMAPVDAQIALAEKIATLPEYQSYLVALEAFKAYTVVGTEQAKALVNADVKVIANTGNALDGVGSAMQLFTPKGGLAIGGMLEAFNNTPEGGALLKALQDRLSAKDKVHPAPETAVTTTSEDSESES